MKERREFTRSRLPFPASIHIDGRCLELDSIEDISANGIFIPLSPTCRAGSIARIRIDLSGAGEGPFIEVQGKATRATDRGVGVRFTRIDMASFEHLKNALRMNAEDPERIEREFTEHLGLKRKV